MRKPIIGFVCGVLTAIAGFPVTESWLNAYLLITTIISVIYLDEKFFSR